MANQFDEVDPRALPAQIAAEMDRLVVYADAQERKVSQLQAALDSRVIIEQAIGILAERLDLPFEDAFEVLRAAARNSRREVSGGRGRIEGLTRDAARDQRRSSARPEPFVELSGRAG